MKETDNSGRRGQGRRTTVGSAAAIALSAVPPFLTGSLSPFMRDELGLTTSRVGIVVAMYFATGALSAVPGGHLAERLASKRTILLANGLTASSLLTAGLLSRTWIHLAFALVVAGAANGIAHPATNLAIVREVQLRRHGIAFGIKQAAAPVATLFAGMTIPLIAVTVGWRAAFVAAALPLPLIAALLPSGRSVGPSTRRGRPTDTRQTLIGFGLVAGFGFGAATTVGAFLVDAIVTAGARAEIGATALTAASISCILVRLVAGWQTDRSETPSLSVVAWLLAVGALGFLVLAAAEGPLLWIIGGMIALGAGWGWTGVLYHAIAAANEDAPAAATSFATVGNAVGAMIGPLLFGTVASVVSFAAAWTTSALMAAAGAALLVPVRRQHADVERPSA